MAPMGSDNGYGALETQLKFETTNREQAQPLIYDLRERNKNLRGKQVKDQYESLETSYDDVATIQGVDKRAKGWKSDAILFWYSMT